MEESCNYGQVMFFVSFKKFHMMYLVSFSNNDVRVPIAPFNEPCMELDALLNCCCPTKIQPEVEESVKLT
jgi:hypothetical protein